MSIKVFRLHRIFRNLSCNHRSLLYHALGAAFPAFYYHGMLGDVHKHKFPAIMARGLQAFWLGRGGRFGGRQGRWGFYASEQVVNVVCIRLAIGRSGRCRWYRGQV